MVIGNPLHIFQQIIDERGDRAKHPALREISLLLVEYIRLNYRAY